MIYSFDMAVTFYPLSTWSHDSAEEKNKSYIIMMDGVTDVPN